jgi:hypothetical protein
VASTAATMRIGIGSRTLGWRFLVERARLQTPTSYTELNATLERRTGLPGFDFARADECAARGHLLYLIMGRNRPATKRMIQIITGRLGGPAACPETLSRPLAEEERQLGIVRQAELPVDGRAEHVTVEAAAAVQVARAQQGPAAQDVHATTASSRP